MGSNGGDSVFQDVGWDENLLLFILLGQNSRNERVCTFLFFSSHIKWWVDIIYSVDHFSRQILKHYVITYSLYEVPMNENYSISCMNSTQFQIFVILKLEKMWFESEIKHLIEPDNQCMHSCPCKLYVSLGQSHLKKNKVCHSSFSLLIFIEYIFQLFARI